MVTVELIKLGAEISSIIGVFVTIAGVIIAIWIFSKEMKKQTEVSQMNFFADYTKRYQEIVMNLPEDLDVETILEDKEVTRYLRVYFDLCSEEYFLFKKGHIIPEVWEEWKEGMQAAFQKKAISKYWQERKSSYKEFSDFLYKNRVEIEDIR